MMRVVFCCSEVVPFAKTGGLADVCGALPAALERYGLDLSIFMPHYRGVENGGHEIRSMGNGLSQATIGRNVSVYFVEHSDFYKRNGLYGDQYGDFGDNLERFHFFCNRTLQVLDGWPQRPDIIHCHDWQTALIPVYLRLFHRPSRLSQVKTVFTIHNIAYQGIFPRDRIAKIGLDYNQYFQAGLEYYNQVNLLKAGIVNADAVTTVSPQYAQEIQTKAFGSGLDGVLRARADGVTGILNGVDYSYWDPQGDPLIPHHYSADDPANKKRNKAALQELCGFEVNENIPLYGFVGRLAQQKGLDLLAAAMENLSRLNLQIVIQGVGEQKYQDMLRYLSTCYSSKLRLFLKFDEPIAHQIYTGSDFFLMPSQYEPCGLSQMISLRYGTIPIVYRTGGLGDTVEPQGAGGNGFVFEHYNRDSFVWAIQQAMQVFHDRKAFEKLIAKAFTYDFSWKKSAEHYVDVYEKLLAR